MGRFGVKRPGDGRVEDPIRSRRTQTLRIKRRTEIEFRNAPRRVKDSKDEIVSLSIERFKKNYKKKAPKCEWDSLIENSVSNICMHNFLECIINQNEYNYLI